MSASDNQVFVPEGTGGRPLRVLQDDDTLVMTLLVALADAAGVAVSMPSSGSNGLGVSDRTMHGLLGELVEQQKITNLHLACLTGGDFEPGDGS